MEKRLILAVALSVLIYAAYTIWFVQPSLPPEPVVPSAVETQAPPDTPPTQPETAPPSSAAPAGAEEEQHVEVENGVFRVVMTNRGARAVSWTLSDFDSPGAGALEVFPHHDGGAGLPLSTDLDDVRLKGEIDAALFSVEREPLAAADGLPEGERIAFVYSDGRGIEARKSFSFRRRSYLVEVEQEVRDRGRPLPSRLTLGPGFAAQESADGRSNYYYESQALWNLAGRVERRTVRKLDPEGGFSGPVRWAGLEDQYFAALVLPDAAAAEVRWRKVQVATAKTGEDAAAKPEENPVLGVSLPTGRARLFVGPKKYQLLHELGSDLERAIWFSSMNWLRPIVQYMFLGLIWIHDHVVANWGWAIVLATLILRLVLFPVNQYSMLSMKKTQLQMQKLQPKIKAIRARYAKKKDAKSRADMNQEMMDLYRQEGVNPMGGLSGCLPLLAQFPILIGFYNMLTVAVELRGAPFIAWIRDLSVQDPYWITPILMTVTMFIQQKLAMTKVKDPQQLQQQRIMLFMPLMFGVICLQMPSGLVIYWFVNNLLGIGQQWLVNRHSGRMEAAFEKA